MIHLHTMRQLMHHDHLDTPERQPVARVRCSEYQLYDLARVEITAYEFAVWFVFFESHDGQVVRFHDWVADCSDAFEEVLGVCGGRTGQGLDEDDTGVWLLVAGVEALDAERHSVEGDGRLFLVKPWMLSVPGRVLSR